MSTGTGRPASVSAGIAAANAHLPKPSETEPRFPGEDGGRSLAEVAHRDLEAALQLLAERAQYITGASGAAIALRRGEHNDMLCRASAGSNAPELGALLSMEYGLSGESVRTRQALRCDDAERDPRVNREGCREMGIASVVVIPIVSEQQVLGVFELFSSKPHAFEERDLLALQRLSEMVETAVKHAVAAQALSAVEESAGAERELPGDIGASEVSSVESAENAIGADPSSSTVESEKDSPPLEPEKKVVAGSEQALKPLFWTAATQTPTSTSRPDDITESISVPAELRDLQRCKACGFPISRGRTLCLECEEKQLRGEQLPQPIVRTASVGAGEQPPQQHSLEEAAVIALAGDAPEISVLQNSSSLEDSSPVEASAAQASSTQASSFQTSRAATSSDESSASTTKPATVEPAIAAPVVEDLSQGVSENVPENDASSDISTLFLSSAAPSESWLAANKYVLGALLAVAIVIGLIVWLR